MPPASPLVVRIEIPGKTFGTAMSEVRSWLDARKMQPVGFRSAANHLGEARFDIRFACEDEARLFEQAFT